METREKNKKATARKALADKGGRKLAGDRSVPLPVDAPVKPITSHKPMKPVRLSVQALAKADTRAFRAQASRELLIIRNAFQLSSPELGSIFGVTRQAIDKWFEGTVPNNRVADVSRVAQVAEELALLFKKQSLPAIVRGPMRGLGNRSVLDVLRTEGPAPMYEFFRMMRELIPGARPVSAQAQPKRSQLPSALSGTKKRRP
ncbi:MAG TPA: hypothetical protein VMF11_04415 [Candidatus Baltobacteraceae bacterium]|nr:hypothetical protein [Candidatus Baltobacteraceae bacterium]